MTVQKKQKILEETYIYFHFVLNTSISALRTQLQGSVHTAVDFPGLCAHSCRASTYYPNPLTRTYRHFPIIFFMNILHFIFLKRIAFPS